MIPALRTLLPLLACSAIALAGCSGDQRSDPAPGVGQPVEGGGEVVRPPAVQQPGQEPGVGAVENDAGFTLRTASSDIVVVEGGGATPIGITLARNAGFSGTIALAAQPASEADAAGLSWNFDRVNLTGSEASAELNVALAVNAMPLQRHQRTLRISAIGAGRAPVFFDLTLQVQPTSAPDVYLLIGQSNMVGFSEPGARQAGAGQPDAPNERIRQLNPTGNDGSNFAMPGDFTDGSIVANPRMSIALDPLHDGYDSAKQSKQSGFVGAGLSFAKSALPETTAEVVLVPAAWSDTGFCARASNLLPGVGWLPAPRSEPEFAGTLLHDRAIARADLALAETGGILRGILWHQGEADASVTACAQAYAENLAALVASLRSRIAPDARGPEARRADAGAQVPFVVGTLSMGTDARGSQLPFTPDKLVVDGALRTVGEYIPLATAVINDDLIPPSYPCGESSCVHFGAAALREMGARYYAGVRGLLGTR